MQGVRERLIAYKRKSYTLQFEDCGVAIQNFVKNALGRNLINALERSARVIRGIKLDYPLACTTLTCASFKVKGFVESNDQASVVGFGFVFSDISQTTIHKYCTAGSTYMSIDGEYRRRFMTTERMSYVFEKVKFLTVVEEMVVRCMRDDELEFIADFCFPENTTTEQKIAYTDSIDCGRFAVKLFSICWLADKWFIEHNLIENHLSPTYIQLISAIGDETYQQFTTTYSHDEQKFIVSALGGYACMDSLKILDPRTTNAITARGTGVKMYPLSQLELELDDADSLVWRDYYVGLKTNELVVNYIAPGFPIYNGWFKLENCPLGIFENPTQATRFDDDTPDITPDITTYDGGAEHQIVKKSMTDTVLCLHSEYIGHTFRDLPKLAARNYTTDVADHVYLAGVIFEYVYQLYALNSIYHIMHGDLHTNNVTLLHMADYRPPNKTLYKVYAVGDTCYVFGNNGIYGGIIDFSQAIFGNREMIATDFDEDYADRTMEVSTMHIKQLIKAVRPRKYDSLVAAIDAELTRSPVNVFKLATLIDTITLLAGIKRTLQTDIPGFKPADETMALVENLIAVADQTFDTCLGYVVRAADIPDWPNYRLLTAVFAPYKTTFDKLDAIVDFTTDVYAYRRPKYEFGTNYATWPPYYQFETAMSIYAAANIPNATYDKAHAFYTGKKEPIVPHRTMIGGADDTYPDPANEWMWN
jgi:hypothetical protein